jgi:hypothetical protein
MNKFDFLIISGDKLYYGHLKARGGDEARKILEEYFADLRTKISKLELKGHAASSFEINEVKL